MILDLTLASDPRIGATTSPGAAVWLKIGSVAVWMTRTQAASLRHALATALDDREPAEAPGANCHGCLDCQGSANPTDGE